MPTPSFTITYKEAYTSEIEFDTQVNDKQQGREQRYPKFIYPKRTFTLKFDKDPTLRASVEAFFISIKGGALPFTWTWKKEESGNATDVTYTCYLDNDTLKENLHHMGFTETELKFITIDTNAITPVTDFDFYYDTQYKFSLDFNTLMDKVLTAQNNRRALWTSPKKSWELTFEKDPIVGRQIEDFFISKRGKFKAFQWTWETSKGGDGVTYWVRFDTDKLTADSFLGWAKRSIPIKEVWQPALLPDEILERDEIIPRKLLEINVPTGAVRILDNETMASLTFDGQIYLGAPLDVQVPAREDNTEVARMKASISNVGQAISGIIGTHGDNITGCDCKLTQVFLNTETFALIPNTEQILFIGQANNLVLNDTTASLDVVCHLGGFDKSMPFMSYGVNCNLRKFKDSRCNYSGSQLSCDRTLQTCKRYGNLEQYSGYPNLPSEQVIKA